MPKSKKPCKHDGNIFPLRDEKSLRKDPLFGWVVDVICEKCSLTGMAQVDVRPKKADWDEKLPDGSDGNEELVRRYGPFKEIGRAQEKELVDGGKGRHILTIKGCDSDESEDGYVMYAHVGYGLVNVDTIFESTIPMPEDLEIQDFWYDDHLKAP